MAEISVVVLTGGRVEHLRRCLVSLLGGSHKPAEIVVVNNDAGGATDQFFQNEDIPSSIKCISGAGGGYAESRNLGVRAAMFDRVAFLDDDCIADHWWVEEMNRALDAFDAVGGPVLPARDHRTPPDFSAELNWLVGLSTPMLWTEAGGKVELPSTSNVAFKRSVWVKHPFQEIGGELQNVRSRHNYLVGREDAQWWRQLRMAGVRTTIAYRAIVWHDFDVRRYMASTTLSRARNDAKAHWKREAPIHELQHAANDVVHYPVRVAADLLFRNEDYRTVRRRHRAWLQRQLSLLNCAVDDHEADFTPAKRTGLYVRSAAGLVADAAKPLFRTASAFAHHNFKQLRPMPVPQNPPKAMTVVCYDFLGDAVLTIPMIEELRGAYPDTRITVLCGETAESIFNALPFVDAVEVLPSGLNEKNPRHVHSVWKAMRNTSPDVIIITYFHHAPPIGLFAATRAPVICWDRDHGMRQQVWQELASAIVSKSMAKHEPAALLDLLGPLQIETRLNRPQFSPPTSAIERAEELLERFDLSGGDYVVLHVDADEGTRKHWPAERYERVAKWLIDEHGLFVFFVGTRRGKRHVEWMNLPRERSVSLHGILNAAELAALQQRARLCIGMDSGPQHLAQAVGAPTLVMFEAIQHARWSPMPLLNGEEEAHPFATVMARDALADWHHAECDRMANNEQVLRITADDVIAAAAELLQRTASRT